MTSKREAVEGWIEEMDFNGDTMVVTKQQTRDFLSDMVDATVKWGEDNRSIGIIQGAVAVTAGLAIGGLVVMAGNKLEQKFKKDKDES